jgi:hypothetical protein
MRSIFSRLAFIGLAAVLAASAIVPASAATRHRAPAPAAASEPYMNEAPVAGRAFGDNQTAGPIWRGPNECFTDEGYGRFTPCDVGGAQ